MLVVIAALSGAGYYLYLNVFNNQYELTYELQRSKHGDPYPRSYQFVAQDDAIAADKAIEALSISFSIDNPQLDKSKYRYQYKHLRLKNLTKDKDIRVPVNLIRNRFLGEWGREHYRFNERDIDWLMFTDTIPYFNYDMSVWLDNPYQEKHLRFIADNDFVAANIAIDTVAYYISHNWYYANRPINDILVINNFTMEFVHTNDWNVRYRITHSPHCEGLNFRRYSVGYRGLVDE